MDREAVGVKFGDRSPVDPGDDVLRALAADGFDISAACWMKLERGPWWFVVVSRTVDELGFHAASMKAYAALDRIGVPARRQSLLTLTRPGEPLGRDVLKLKATRPPGMTVYGGATIGGHEVEEYALSPDLA